jgi:ADP-ribose pyrophosphatase
MTRTVVYRGRRIQVAEDTLPLPDGRAMQREVVLHPGAVAVLPLVDDRHICLLRNRRYAVGETLWEIPAGTLQPPESPEAAAVRELQEETGYRAGRWRKLAEFYPSPGILSERMVLFVAQDLTPGPLHLEPDEQLEPRIVPWSDAVAWALDGTIRDAKTLVALLLGDRLRESSGGGLLP